MASVNITVPTAGINKDQELRAFVENVSARLAALSAGEHVKFVDDNGSDAEVFWLNCANDSSVELVGLEGKTDADKKIVYLIKGGWHHMAVHKIYKDGTTTTAGLHVKVWP